MGVAQTIHSGQPRIENHEIETAGNDPSELERFVAVRHAPDRETQSEKDYFLAPRRSSSIRSPRRTGGRHCGTFKSAYGTIFYSGSEATVAKTL